MVQSLVNEVGALRWYLPVRSPADRNVDDRCEGDAIEAAADAAELVRETSLPLARRAPYDVPNNSDGDGTPARWLASSEVEGRAAVAVARRPESP